MHKFFNHSLWQLLGLLCLTISGLNAENNPLSKNNPGAALNPPGDTLEVISLRGTPENVRPIVVDPSMLTGHTYIITFFEVLDSTGLVLVWRLTDQTAGIIKLDSAQIASPHDPAFPHPDIDGIQWQVTLPHFKDFQTVANAGGPLDPPEGAAANFAGFPSHSPGDGQQVGPARWLIHTADNGMRCCYSDFLSRITRGGIRWPEIIPNDFEWRFTGNSKAWRAFQDAGVMDVPFELWNIGINTPNDPSDDYRMVPWILDDDEDSTFNMGQPGSKLFGIYDHTVSNGDDDPYTDWIYWLRPQDTSSGQAGYLTAEAEMIAGTYTGERETEAMARTVLVNWDGGAMPPYNQDLPETGTIFRILSNKPNNAGDILLVIALPPLGISENNNMPVRFHLYQNYPNPFNPSTTIEFSLPTAAEVSLVIYNITGQMVERLIDRSNLAPGQHSVEWVPRSLPSGVYFYRLRVSASLESAGGIAQSRKMVLMK